MALDQKIAELVENDFNYIEPCLECKVSRNSVNNIWVEVLNISKELNLDDVMILDHVEINLGDTVLVAFVNGNIKKPVIIGRIK
ncbi:hypothetical protein [Methanobrevibacter filiformis]|uniref:Uncharacterized protein n=1 Tax=Methanobrevibacter filiformis TaxID=55758 RepID=A0A166CXQ5_9EURY|nr:hypothetical protein [Methanobrevibacter filiformis]KZX17477.1 hypothetical protein MBFIL_01350 [Methanobrevibacter filiformis]